MNDSKKMIEWNFRIIDLIFVLILYVYVVDSFKIIVMKGKICYLFFIVLILNDYKYNYLIY